MPEESQITQGYKNAGDYNPTDYVGKKSLFGPRKDKNYWEKSIGERLLNMITDRLHLTSPPSYKDGYNTERSTEVPLRESAAGQEAERTVNTLGKIGIGTAVVANPVSAGLGLASAYGATAGANYGLDLLNKRFLNPKGKQYGVTPRALVSTLAAMQGFMAGQYAGAKVPVTFNSRSMNFGSRKPVGKALVESNYTPYRFELWGDKLKHSIWKQIKRSRPTNIDAAKGPILGAGSEANVYTNANNPYTVIKAQKHGLVLPDEYQGNLGTASSNIAQMIANNIARIKNRGAYTADITPIKPEKVDGMHVPTFIQEKMWPVNDIQSFTPKQTRALTRLMMNAKPYADAHLGNVAMDSNGMFWFVDSPLKSQINGGFQTGSPWYSRESYPAAQHGIPNSSISNPFSSADMRVFIDRMKRQKIDNPSIKITKPLDFDIDKKFNSAMLRPSFIKRVGESIWKQTEISDLPPSHEVIIKENPGQ